METFGSLLLLAMVVAVLASLDGVVTKVSLAGVVCGAIQLFVLGAMARRRTGNNLTKAGDAARKAATEGKVFQQLFIVVFVQF